MNILPAISLIALLILTPGVARAQGKRDDYQRAASLTSLAADPSFRQEIDPHWLPGKSVFWYQHTLPDGKGEYVLVDADKGERRAQPMPGGSSPLGTSLHFINHSGQTVRLWWVDADGHRLSYGELKAGETREQHTYLGHEWQAEDPDGHVLGMFTAAEVPRDATIEASGLPPKPESKGKTPSHDWNASVKENNLWITHQTTGEEVQLSRDGTASEPYQEPFRWSPDGSRLVVEQVEVVKKRRVYLIESSPRDQLQPRLASYEYQKPGDRIEHPHPRLFDVTHRCPVPIREDLFPDPWSLDEFHWSLDGARFYFLYNQRGHQVERIVAVDAATGEARAIVEERSATFIDYSQKTYLHWLDDTNELVWASERDGWNHLYLVDALTGAVKTPLTHGNWNVREVERIDASKRQAWLRVMGVRPGEDPYHFHLARVNLDGTGFTLLTDGDGTHRWHWSPDFRYFTDQWSRVDQPPVTELRREADGGLVCGLEQASAAVPLASGWHPPQRFTAKARDGTTDIYGVIFQPTNFDPARKYPVIEQIYAGPQDFFVPERWGFYTGVQQLAELGFIVVQIDGLGTNWRGKAFHDVCWKNLKDAGLPDRIAWMRAAAATRPWMDLSRVGVYGGSAGGQNALGAMLFQGDFYQAAVADCGCHDNRMDKIWWNEAWMGWPVGPEYADNSNVTHAAQLRGPLLLVVGEMDHNVDPASTMQVVNALIKADKDFDLLVVPGADHGAGGSPYGRRRLEDFFVRHLLGVEPRG